MNVHHINSNAAKVRAFEHLFAHSFDIGRNRCLLVQTGTVCNVGETGQFLEMIPCLDCWSGHVVVVECICFPLGVKVISKSEHNSLMKVKTMRPEEKRGDVLPPSEICCLTFVSTRHISSLGNHSLSSWRARRFHS